MTTADFTEVIPEVRSRPAVHDRERPRLGPVEQLVAERLADARRGERLRIASAIHDVVLQELAAIQIESRIMRSAVAAEQHDAATRAAARVDNAAQRAVEALRGTIAGLRDPTVEANGLEAALDQHAAAFSWETGIDVFLSASDVDDVDVDVALLAYECCQEALRNVARHAHANRAEVRVRTVASWLLLSVTDDGIGLERSPYGTDDRNRFGLALLRDKVELHGGSIVVQSPTHGGTTMRVSLPVR